MSSPNLPIDLPADPAQALRAQLVQANHILAAQGVLDAYGHVSVRQPQRPGTFLLSRSLAPARVQADDLVEYDLGCEPLQPGAPIGYAERFIHGEIYRARPDVHAVVHSHSHAMVAFGAAGARLLPVFHMGACVAGHACFDLRQHRGDSDLLVKDGSAGRYLAAALGQASLVLMRGHGATMVGASLEEAVFRAVYAETNAGLQIQASQLGTVLPLSDGEVQHCLVSQRQHARRAWDLWCEAVR